MLNTNSVDMELNNSQIDSAKTHLDLNDSKVNITETNATDTNLTEDMNVSDANQSQKSKVATKFEILTKRSLWIGYIDMDSFKKKQITIQSSFDLDPSKNYLVVFGHGMLKIDLGIEVKEYSDIHKKYFKFENGELTELTRSEFKKLNRGSTW